MLRTDKLEGIGIFTYESFRRIVTDHPEHRFLFLFDRPFDNRYIFGPNVTPVIVPPPARHPILYYIWCEWSLPRVFKKYKPDLFVGTDGFISIRSGLPSLSVIHDIHFMHHPKDLPFFARKYYTHFFPKYAQHSAGIATVSKYTADDVIATYGIPKNKIDVVYNGASEGFRPLDDSKKSAIRNKFAEGKLFFLFIGAIHQRKNIGNLLRAFESFKTKKSSDVKLILAGTRRWWTDEMESTLQSMSSKNDVIFTGRVSDQDLYDLAGSALAITYVSTFEGFGIPIVEGMKAGTPVLTSDITSMPEIAGNAALLCNPFSVESIADALMKLFSDEELRKKLTSAGLERSKIFTWDQTAQGLWRSIEKITTKQ